jgi:nickel-type superoxide dismutase maturation protease
MRRGFISVLASVLGLGIVGGLAFLVSTRRYLVQGRSMLPAYPPGDRLLVNRLAYLRDRPRKGDVVVVRPPWAAGRLDLKRITAVPGDEAEVQGSMRRLGNDQWFITGDNAAESTDSRQFGPIRRRDIIGKVLFRY